MEHLEAALAEVVAKSVWLVRDGRFVGYHPGAPTFVNAAFLAERQGGAFPRGTAMVVLR